MNDILLSYRHFVKIVCRLIFDIIPCYIIFCKLIDIFFISYCAAFYCRYVRAGGFGIFILK